MRRVETLIDTSDTRLFDPPPERFLRKPLQATVEQIWSKHGPMPTLKEIATAAQDAEANRLYAQVAKDSGVELNHIVALGRLKGHKGDYIVFALSDGREDTPPKYAIGFRNLTRKKFIREDEIREPIDPLPLDPEANK